MTYALLPKMMSTSRVLAASMLLGMLLIAVPAAAQSAAQTQARLKAMVPIFSRLCANPTSQQCLQLIKSGGSICETQAQVCAGLVPAVCNQNAEWKKRCGTLAPIVCASQLRKPSLFKTCISAAAPYTGGVAKAAQLSAKAAAKMG